MIHLQNTKHVQILFPKNADTNAVTGYVDCLDSDYVNINVDIGTAAATDTITNLTLAEGTAATGAWTTISGCDGSAGDFTIPTPSTSVGKAVRFFLDMPKRKRYIRVLFDPSTANHIVCATAELGRLRTLPDSDSEFGANDVVIV